MSGASNCTQRTDDFVSGSRTQTWTLAVLCLVLAVAVETAKTARPATAIAAQAKAVDLRKSFFKIVSFVR
jgi:hypothetical protein